MRMMIERGGRGDKGRSGAHSHIFRTALVRNWPGLALMVVESVPYDVGTLLDAVDADYDRIRDARS